MPVLFSSHSFARCGPAAAVRPQAAPRLGLEPPPLRRWAVQQCGGRQPIQTAAQLTAAGDDDASCEWVERSYGPGRGKPLPLRPQLAAELRPLAALLGVADTAALSRAVAALGPKREQGLLEHGPAVAELLLSLGVPQPQVAQLLQRCPLLFSRPAEQRAALLFGQLARLGLTAPEAARCFVQMPTAAGTPDFEPAIPVLAELFAAGSSAGGSRSGEQLLGDLLRKQPAAVGLLEWNAGTLQQRISNLAQRYGPHWEQENKEVVIVAAMQPNALLLTRPAEHLLSLEAVLQQELGQQPGDGTRQLASILQHQARAAGCSPDTLRQRARALLAEFGRGRLLQVSLASLAELLAVDATTWQRALAVWQLLGVPNPAALGLGNTRLLVQNWLKPDRLASLLALQQLLPWQPTAADAVQQCATYVANYAPQRLIGRLLFLQQEGLLPLLVADKRAAQQQWRQQRRLRAGQGATDEPQFIGLRDTAVLSAAKFCAMLSTMEAAQPGQPVGGSSSHSSIAERYRAFMAHLPQLPAYRQLLAAGEAESRRLAALLPPELLPQAEGSV